MTTRHQQGFTLVELLIVVVILGILAAVVIPQFNSAASESKEAAMMSNLATVRQAIEFYKVQHDDAFPTANIIAQLTATTDVNGNSGTKYGPYLRSFPASPITNTRTVKTAATLPGSPSGPEAWVYATGTGDFRSNHVGTAPSGTAWFGL